MEIIAHRGFWKEEEEKNEMSAFQRAFQNDLGLETDFRDLNQKLVISHNMANHACPLAEDLFRLYQRTDYTLALNVKADGLQLVLKNMLEKYDISKYFCFDMSVCDTLGYIDENLLFFTRESEYETIPSFYREAEGVWIDGFISDEWITEKKIRTYLEDGKKVCLVSPELHRRPYKEQWEKYKSMSCITDKRLMLCTDYPKEAVGFFYG